MSEQPLRKEGWFIGDELCPYCKKVCELDSGGDIRKCRPCGVMWSYNDVYVWTKNPDSFRNLGWYSLPDATLLVVGSEEL